MVDRRRARGQPRDQRAIHRRRRAPSTRRVPGRAADDPVRRPRASPAACRAISWAPAAGQEADARAPPAASAEPSRAPPRARRACASASSDGMADELDGNAGAPVERGLEREHRQHRATRVARIARDPPRPPRPHLRRDEVDDRDAGAPRHARQSQVELREVDQRRATAGRLGPRSDGRAVGATRDRASGSGPKASVPPMTAAAVTSASALDARPPPCARRPCPTSGAPGAARAAPGTAWRRGGRRRPRRRRS